MLQSSSNGSTEGFFVFWHRGRVGQCPPVAYVCGKLIKASLLRLGGMMRAVGGKLHSRGVTLHQSSGGWMQCHRSFIASLQCWMARMCWWGQTTEWLWLASTGGRESQPALLFSLNESPFPLVIHISRIWKIATFLTENVWKCILRANPSLAESKFKAAARPFGVQLEGLFKTLKL